MVLFPAKVHHLPLKPPLRTHLGTFAANKVQREFCRCDRLVLNVCMASLGGFLLSM